MSANSQVVEMDHVFPWMVPVDTIPVKQALLGSCRYGDDDQRALETSQHPGEGVLA